ncbi:hypothetical protein [uncultured Planktosalinus sp.]|uniref:hypothetical protein n=1 Tax=uncultured Planktosalinus sp. TaxID=1810935 RepID=UPI0030DDA8D0|tara:strand:+ start:515 stop:1264 length:750 start_codon:yes stop_codon:yes gene_type:complete
MNWEIFRDQIWNFIGVIIAFLTIVITLIIFFLQRRKKAISYEITSKTALLTSKEKLEGKIKILYNNSEVENVNFYELKISNSGNLGIPSEDYERPIRFIFDTGVEILSAEIIESNPKSLITELVTEGNEIIITPVLMNSKDSFTIKSIVSNSEETEILVDARIKDVKEIKKVGESHFSLIFAGIGLILTIAGMIQMIRINERVKVETPWTLEKSISAGLIFLGYIFMTSFIIKNRTHKKFIKKLIKISE